MEDLPRALQKRANGRKKRALLQTTLPCGTSELHFEVDWARRGPVIHDHLDSGSIGMLSKHFLYTDVQLHGWRWPDVIHIKNKNCKNAIIAANLSWARHEKSLTSSFNRGPFEGAAFFATLSETAATYFDTYDWTDDLYGAAYPLLAIPALPRTMGPSYGTAEHMQDIFEKARAAPCFRKTGSAVKPGRYFDVWNHSAGEDDYNACYLLVLSYVGLYHGFFQTVADTPLFRNALTLEGDGDACEDPHGSTPLMLHLRPDEPDEGIRTAVRDSDRDLKQLRRQCKNTLHVVCEVFAKHDLPALWLLLEEVVNPFKYSHGSIIKKFKSKDDTLAWHVDMALGSWTRVLLRATSGLANRQLFVQAGLTRWSLASPAIVSFDDETSGKIARAVVNFWSHYVADEIRTNRSYSDALPGKFAAVLQDDPAKVAQELMILREWLDILEEFEIAMDGNEWLVTFHQSLIFPVSRWVRSVLIGLAEGGDCVPSDLKSRAPPNVWHQRH